MMKKLHFKKQTKIKKHQALMLLLFIFGIFTSVQAQLLLGTSLNGNFSSDGVVGDWGISSGGTPTVSGGRLNVTMGGTVGSYRGDIQYNSANDAGKDIVLNSDNDAIFAVKFIGDRPEGNFKLEMLRVVGESTVWDNSEWNSNSGDGNYTTINGNKVYYYRLSDDTDFTGGDLTYRKINIIIADSDDTSYSVDWIATFKSTGELQAHMNALDDTSDADEPTSDTGSVAFEFNTDADQEGWVPQQSPASVTVTGGVLKTEFNASQDGSGSKYRADLKYTNTPINLHAGDYPIVAVKFNVYPGDCRITFDTNIGVYGGTFNTYNDTYKDSNGIISYDLAGSTFTGGVSLLTDALTSFSLFQFKIADGTSVDASEAYEIDWIKTFENQAALDSYVTSLTSEEIKITSSDLNISPNPSTVGVFNLHLGQNFTQKNANVRVYNTLGSLIIDNNYDINTTKTIQVTHNLSPGIYYVQVNKTANIKLIVR
ncbi:DUF4979 domain-containing protein [Wenyingzhuangia sp. IMCC45467]